MGLFSVRLVHGCVGSYVFLDISSVPHAVNMTKEAYTRSVASAGGVESTIHPSGRSSFVGYY